MHNRLATALASKVKSLLLERLDLTCTNEGTSTLPSWDPARAENNLQVADVVVAIISSGFATSKNVGFTMGTIDKMKKAAARAFEATDNDNDSNQKGNAAENNGVLPIVSAMLATSQQSDQQEASGWPFERVGGVDVPKEIWGGEGMHPIKFQADASKEQLDVSVKRLLFLICKTNPSIAAAPRAHAVSSHANRRSIKVAPAPQSSSAMPPVAAPLSSPQLLARSPSFKRRNTTSIARKSGSSFRLRSGTPPPPTVSVEHANIESIT